MAFARLFSVFLLSLARVLTAASPLPQMPQAGLVITPEHVQLISPATSSCAGAPKPTECRDAHQIAPILNEVFAKFDIVRPNEMAALVALMAFESESFKYQRNYFPGIPGQGTRNMQSPHFNLLYAKSIPELSSKLRALPAGSPKEVLQMLTDVDEYDFGSAAWFLTTQCSSTIRGGLQDGGLGGWNAYLTDCVDVPSTDSRRAFWRRAKQVFGVEG